MRGTMSRSLQTSFLAGALTALIALAAVTAWAADPQQTRSFGAWKQQDHCAEQAFKASPDYTPAGNAKRDRLMRLCEAQKHVPVRGDLSDSQLPVRPDDAAQ